MTAAGIRKNIILIWLSVTKVQDCKEFSLIYQKILKKKKKRKITIGKQNIRHLINLIMDLFQLEVFIKYPARENSLIAGIDFM